MNTNCFAPLIAAATFSKYDSPVEKNSTALPFLGVEKSGPSREAPVREKPVHTD
jgi:hypothetical protein